ncbi:hypothetical protein O6P43_032445 [Quillaja saponaria]|uniref:Uncharacterized protein n=1 Tax=Quillaja saponaria TaxID=32244 RepID=A0AAD7P5L5_QUISA|nr:hypothetical protein O6P43_032445 [Quillaja saponaria]
MKLMATREKLSYSFFYSPSSTASNLLDVAFVPCVDERSYNWRAALLSSCFQEIAIERYIGLPTDSATAWYILEITHLERKGQ